MPDQPVLLAEDAGGVRVLTLNRPDTYNAFNNELKETLLSELRWAAGEEAVRAIVLTGAGRAFSAGQDLKEHIALMGGPDGAQMRTVEEHYTPLVRAVLTMPKPIIAAVNGTAAGAGAALAFACDLRIAAESAKFILAFAGVGLSADTAASWTLPRLVGYGRAMEMMLLGEPVDAPQAHTTGMVNRVVPDGAALAEATRLAQRLATGPTAAYARIKEALLTGASANLDAALATEARTQAELGVTADHLEAVQAFVTKRKPSFTGH
ncbi:MAG TPA: enoyl-CoA hydratase-related protein [Pseudonocardiaceae bacterium]|nr:enoyl-CoA hydratase-related protein [Pseudonocardiaceae bacterium]